VGEEAAYELELEGVGAVRSLRTRLHAGVQVPHHRVAGVAHGGGPAAARDLRKGDPAKRRSKASSGKLIFDRT
jgi:hypothetical protein